MSEVFVLDGFDIRAVDGFAFRHASVKWINDYLVELKKAYDELLVFDFDTRDLCDYRLLRDVFDEKLLNFRFLVVFLYDCAAITGRVYKSLDKYVVDLGSEVK